MEFLYSLIKIQEMFVVEFFWKDGDYILLISFVWFFLYIYARIGEIFHKLCRKLLHCSSFVISAVVYTVIIISIAWGDTTGGIAVQRAVYVASFLMLVFSLSTYPYLYLKKKLADMKWDGYKNKVPKSSFSSRVTMHSLLWLWNPLCLSVFISSLMSYTPFSKVTEDVKPENKHLYDADGYDFFGYDADGYDADGYDADGYDADGYDADGYDFFGYNIAGYNHFGLDDN